MVKKLYDESGDGVFVQRLKFVFVSEGKKPTGKVQGHIQRESYRKQRWQTARRGLQMGRAASASFHQDFDAPPVPVSHWEELREENAESTFNPDFRTTSELGDEGSSSQTTPAAHKRPSSHRTRRHLSRPVRVQFPGTPLQITRSCSPKTILGGGRIDPFRTYPITGPNTDRYVDFCKLFLCIDLSQT